MTVSNASSYTSVYESLYASKQTTTGKTEETSAASGTYQTADEYLSHLRQKYSNVNITVADFSSDRQLKSYMFSSGGYNNIAISSTILEKMASDPATAEKYEKLIADLPNEAAQTKADVEATGGELIACGTVIDKNGKVTYWSISKAKTIENPGTKYKEKVQKQLEEKRAEKKEKEKAEAKKAEEEAKKEQPKKADKIIVTASSVEDLLKKAREAFQETDGTVRKKDEQPSGANLDLKV